MGLTPSQGQVHASSWMDITITELLSRAVNYLAPLPWYRDFSFWNVIVLSLTAIALFWYSWETRKLRIEAQTTNKYSSRPMVVVRRITSAQGNSNWRDVIITNIGKGPALNIEARISQIHPNGGYTYLVDLSDDGKFNNLGAEKDQIIHRVTTIEAYLQAQGTNFSHGVQGKHVIIFTYEDIAGMKYHTVTLIENVRGVPTIKKTITGDYSSGKLKHIL